MSLVSVPYEECGECGHYPAYCPPGGSGCSAWDPDRDDNKCACGGRKPPKPKPRPAADLELLAHGPTPDDVEDAPP